MPPAKTEAPASLGRYQVAEELGRGAMGVVYLAVDPVIARPVAIKVIKESEHMTPPEVEQFQARFRHEAEAAGRLSHPDIVQVYDIGPNYMVMEYIDGKPLSTVLREGVSFTLRQVIAIVQRAADAIDYAHRAGIVHRDIKPGNIMLLAGDALKVMDFGVARLANSNLTAAGTVVGSVRYMAPEQMMGEKVDGRADVFSLAAVAYELLTTRSPFPGKTITEVVSRVVRGGHVPPCQAEPRLPPEMNTVFSRAFATRADDRYGRALEFAKDLADAARGALDKWVIHGAHTDVPTDVDAPAANIEDPSARTSTSPRHQALGPPPPVKSSDETLVMAAPSVPAAEPETSSLRSPGVPPGAPVSAAQPGLAKTLIMEAHPTHREGVVHFESDPAGAAVFVDGTKVGETPVPEFEIGFGKHLVRMEAPGRDPAVIDLEITPARPLRVVSVALAPERPRDGTIRPGQHTAFGAEVVAPVRVSGELPVYPAGARARGVCGAPVVELWIGEHGEVMDLAVVESAGAILDGALLDAVGAWRFTPARVRGVPVSVRITVQHFFRP